MSSQMICTRGEGAIPLALCGDTLVLKGKYGCLVPPSQKLPPGLMDLDASLRSLVASRVLKSTRKLVRVFRKRSPEDMLKEVGGLFLPTAIFFVVI